MRKGARVEPARRRGRIDLWTALFLTGIFAAVTILACAMEEPPPFQERPAILQPLPGAAEVSLAEYDAEGPAIRVDAGTRCVIVGPTDRCRVPVRVDGRWWWVEERSLMPAAGQGGAR